MNPVRNNSTQTVEKTSTQTDSPWTVLIHDDPVNLMDYVTHVIQKVMGYSSAKATQLMLEVHNDGKAIVWAGQREKAEFYVQQLHTFQLNASLENI